MGVTVTKDILQEKYFIFNGTSSVDFRLICSGGGTFSAPKRAYETVNIPGRNGSLLLDKGYYNDGEVEFKDVGFIPETVYQENDTALRLVSIREWLLQPIGYKRLECSWQPDEYRLGYISKDFDPDMLDGLNGGTIDLTFTCKPQRFLKSGENEVNVSNGMVLINPTAFDATPLIAVTGSGTITITNNDGEFKIKTDRDAIIDCDLMDVYSSSGSNLNSNSKFTLPDGDDKIHLAAGTNTFTYDGFTKVTIVCRWWRI